MNIRFDPRLPGLPAIDYAPASESDLAPTFGLTLERVLFRRTDRISARIDVMYNSHKFYSYTERDNLIGGKTRDDTWFSFTGIKIPLLLQYSITGSRIVPYASFGAAYQMFLTKSYKHSAEVENSLHEINTVNDQLLMIKSAELTGIGGIGCKVRITGKLNFHLMCMFEYGTGFFKNGFVDDYRTSRVDPFLTSSLQPSVLMGLTF